MPAAVFAANTNAATLAGDPCYPDLMSIPGGVARVVIVTAPAGTEPPDPSSFAAQATPL